MEFEITVGTREPYLKYHVHYNDNARLTSDAWVQNIRQVAFFHPVNDK